MIEVLRRPVESAQFGSWAFTDRAKASGLVPSMGSVGDCFDNSMIEAFWSRMQVELLDRQSWRTRIELANAIFEYLEIWHNRRRRHSALGWVSPLEFENQSKIVVAGESSHPAPETRGIPRSPDTPGGFIVSSAAGSRLGGFRRGHSRNRRTRRTLGHAE